VKPSSYHLTQKILGKKPFYKIAISHRERRGGSGYPDGLKGESFPLAARIVTVANVVDALTHKRPYKPAWPVEAALNEMRKLSDEVFGPKILDIFIHMQSQQPKTSHGDFDVAQI
jgi:putative two-component system response regulator